MIYLDYAATTPPHPEVIAIMQLTQQSNWANPSAAHTLGRKAKALVDECHFCIAEYCSVLPSEVLITGSGTEAMNTALHSATQTILRKYNTPGTILVSPLEHKVVQEYVTKLQMLGWQILYLPLQVNGTIDLEAVKELCKTTNQAVLCVQWVNSETGLIQPIEAITTTALEFGIPYICDASQGVPHLTIPDILPDYFVFSPHKFYGPKGVGVLIAKKHQDVFPLIVGGGQEYGFRSGTENTAAMAGTSVALQLLRTERQQRYEHNAQLQKHLEQDVLQKRYAMITTNTDRIPSTTNLLLAKSSAETALMKCDLHSICISTGSACSSSIQEEYPVVMHLGLSKKEAQRTVRISTGIHTTANEITQLCTVLKSL